MSEFEIVKSEYNALDETGNYKTHYFKTSADQVVGLGRMKSFSYSVGDVVYSDINNKIALRCSTGGTTSADALDVTNVVAGQSITDGSVVWDVVNRISSDFPVGYIYFSLEKTVPVGRIPAQGATYNRELYADLWAYAQERGLVISESEWQVQASANDGNCAFYSTGDGSTTFRVPSIKCWVKGADGEEVGDYLEAGSPNIKGNACVNLNTGSGYENGALYTVYTGVWGTAGTQTNDGRTLYLDASRSSSVYRDDIDTVQPKSLVGQWLIVAFGTASNVGNADVANVMQAVEQVQTGLGALEDKVQNISFVPNYNAGVVLTRGQNVTIPSDGLLFIMCDDSATTSYVTINGEKINISVTSTGVGSSVTFMVGKNDVVKVEFGRTYANDHNNAVFYPYK